MLATQRSEADAFVSIAGIARPAGQVLRDQLRPQLPPPMWEESERILGSLEAGLTTDSVPQLLYALYRPSVQPYFTSFLREAGRSRCRIGRHQGNESRAQSRASGS